MRAFSALLPTPVRARFGQRATGLVLALVIELLLVLALLTLARTVPTRRQDGASLSAFDIASLDEPSQENPHTPEAEAPQRPQAQPPPEQPQPPVPPPPPVPALIPMTAKELAAFDIARIPQRPAPERRTAGPSAAGVPGDTPLMAGTGPNGEPLYAAQWYRKPYDSELRGYLSTADGPGWGLIACRTVADYRVEACVFLDEYPTGSRIGRAVLEAAWQFRVRPPRRGGQTLIGEWVGIRIDYERRER